MLLEQDTIGKDINIGGYDFQHCKPQSVNMWFGGPRCHSPVHRVRPRRVRAGAQPNRRRVQDMADNLYAVLTGKKTFTIFHPLDSPYLYLTGGFRQALYTKDKVCCTFARGLL